MVKKQEYIIQILHILQYAKILELLVIKLLMDWLQEGRSSIDWFYGFKLHMTINDKSEIIAIKITSGN